MLNNDVTKVGGAMKKQRRVGIRFKITSGYAVLICFLVIAAVVLNSQITGLQQERNSVIEYDSQMRTLSNRLERQIINMESSLNRYLITQEDKYLENYYKYLGTWETVYKELDDVVHNYSNENQLGTIYTSITSWLDEIGQPLLESILTNDESQMLARFNGEQSSAAISELQAQFSEFRNLETASIQAEILSLDNSNTRLTYTLFLVLGILAIITIFVFNTISRKITDSITEVTSAIHEMNATSGKKRKRLTAQTNDEVRDLVNATNSLLETLEGQQWLQVNLNEAVTAYQGVDTLNELGEVLLKQLTTRTKSSYGAFYVQDVYDKQQYFKLASFAESANNVGKEQFHVDEGFIGQAVREKRTLSYENNEEGFRFMETGLGSIPIKNGVIIPIEASEEVVAVLEFASMERYTAQQRKLLQEVVRHLGVTITSIQSRMEIIRLLNESQAMTEELQVQSEELQTQSEELKMQTEELTTINEQLEERTHEAEQKTNALEKAQFELKQSAEQLRQSSNYKSEFLANMSHELRTPLNSILILSEMLAENNDQRLTEDELEYANVIHNSGEDLLLLINDILDLSKVEAGKMDLWFDEMDVEELASHVYNLFMPIAEQKNLELHIEFASPLPHVFHTDIKRFHQIINNLLSNALKFTEQGAVTVKVEQATVTPSMQQRSEVWLAVHVSDTGIGITPDKQQIIFDSFQQADGATVRKYGGTGLGLSICREFTKLLGGWITVHSEEAQGSTFTVFLPSLPNGQLLESHIIEQPPQLSEPSDTLIPYTKGNVFAHKRILVVDDDYRNIYALKQALEQKGVEVLEASNGIECLNILQTVSRVDAVLMDIMMPEMDGYETMEHIRHDLELTTLPVIALTAKAMKQDKERAIEAGASDYITKPLNLEQLFSVLTVWLTSEEPISYG